MQPVLRRRFYRRAQQQQAQQAKAAQIEQETRAAAELEAKQKEIELQKSIQLEKERQRAVEIELRNKELDIEERKGRLDQSRRDNPATSEPKWSLPKTEIALSTKALLGVLILFWLKRLKENASLPWYAKAFIGACEIAISGFIGTRDTVNILEGVLLVAPVLGFELFWGLRWKPTAA